MRTSKIGTALGALGLLLAGSAPLWAATPPGRPAPEPIATEQLAGTTLTLTPTIPWERAELRVSGPEGYALSQRFEAGTPISTVLTRGQEVGWSGARANRDAGASTSATTPPTLPEGLYRYEVFLSDFTGQKRVHTGLFFVENGALVSREAKRAALARTAGALEQRRAANSLGAGGDRTPDFGETYGELFYEYVIIDEYYGADDEITFLSLRNIFNNPDWYVRNHDGAFSIDAGYYGDGFDDLTIVDGTGVGIGTSTPFTPLHVLDPTPGPGGNTAMFVDEGDVLVQRDGASAVSFRFSNGSRTWNFFNNAGGVFQLRDATGGTSPMVLRPGAVNNLLTLRGPNIGIRHANPGFPIHHISGARLTAGGVWTNASSRALKTAFEAIDPVAVLAKVAALPVQAWRYKVEEKGTKHLGPVAEDFQRLFGLGDGESIGTVDANGVALAAIQGLRQLLDEERATRARELAAKDAEIAALRERLEVLEERMH